MTIEILCFVVDRHCSAVPTWRCVFLYVEPTRRPEACHVHCDGALCFIFISHYEFPTSHYYYEASHLAASFAVCCHYSMHASQCLVHCAPCHDKGCRVGCCLKLRCCLLCFLEGERGGQKNLEVLEVVAMIFGNFQQHLPTCNGVSPPN